MKYYATVGFLKVTHDEINHVFCGLIKRYKTHHMQSISTEEAVKFFFEGRDNLWIFKSLDEAKIYAASMNTYSDKRFTTPIYEITLPDSVGLESCGGDQEHHKYRLPDDLDNIRSCVSDLIGVHIFHPNFANDYYQFDGKRLRIMQHYNALELGRLFRREGFL